MQLKPTPKPKLTPEEWQHVSVMLAQEIRTGVATQIAQSVWNKIQPACKWDSE